jgi:hypothetical protein
MMTITKEPTEITVREQAPSNVTNVTDPMIAMIERVVLDPNASIEKLEKMLAMRERLEDRALEERKREQELSYLKAFADCQKELKVVVKNKDNKQTNSRYADLAALAEQADPIIHKHGLSTSFEPAGTNEKGEQRIRWTIAHKDGHIRSDVADLPADKAGAKGTVNKTDTHAFGSTATYGRRYLKLMLFDIATADDDGNAAGSPLISPAQHDELLALADEVSADKAAFCRYFEINSFADIPAKHFDKAKKALEQRRGRKDADL